MRWCQFLLVLVLMPSRYAAKGIEFPFDDTLDELDPDEGPWDPGPSLFVDSDEFYSTTAEDSFFSAGSGPYTAVSADNASTCMIEDPPLSRIRERSGVCENENEFSGSSTAVYDPRLPGTLAEQEEIKSQWCPEEAYHGVLDIPVCSQYEDIQILPSDLTDVDTGEPLSATGLKTIVTGSLITSPSDASCVESRAYCCQAWLPQLLELASRYGTGYWCAKARTAQLQSGN